MNPAAARREKESRASLVQRRAAAPESSVWVAASAGTGKTKVLTDRVLSLMLHGTPPARILCLTFTKAAAAEMANRLAERLAGWTAKSDAELDDELAALLDGQPDAERRLTARRLFARVLDAPGGIKIQTLHAFCQSVLGRFPLEAGVPPHFQVLDERSAAELLAAAREEVLSSAHLPGREALAEAIASVIAHAHEQTFAELVAELIKERARLLRLVRNHGDVAKLAGALRRTLGIGEGENAASVLAEAAAEQAFDAAGLRRAAAAMTAASSATDRAHGAAIADWLDAPTERRIAAFQDYLAAFFKERGEGEVFKTLIHKDALAAAPGADPILAAEAARLAAVRAKLRALSVAAASAALLHLGDAILSAYRRHKLARATLDYDDLILETRDLLARPGVAAWVLYKLDGGLDHILIDEAQDTNPEQWEVVEALSAEFFAGQGARDRPRTIFAVGDAKQSIFGFQRAAPAAFAAMRDHFAERARAARQRWDRVELEVSFRSTAAVLEAVDRVFAESDAQVGVLFGESRVSHDPVRVGQAGLVELWPPASPAAADEPEAWAPPEARSGALPPRALLARLIARKIWHWTVARDGVDDPQSRLDSKGRRLRAGDFLVLVRRRNAFVEELVRELKQREVPVAGVDRMVLTDQLAVMDLVALGRSLLLPDDDLTLATVLKGPLIGLDEDQLFALAHGRKGSLWRELRRRRGEDPAFQAAHTALAALRARADYVRPYEIYGELLGAGGGRRRLLGRLGPEAGDPIEEFLSLALSFEREQVPSLEGFLHWLEAGAQTVKRDMEHGGDAVRIMTVHGAKGLQAPVVIMPDTLQAPQAPRGLFWLADHDGLALWPIRKAYDGPAATAARAAAAEAQAEEYRRLLYVAMTRAEDRLYVCGWNTRQKAPENCWYHMVKRALVGTAEPTAFDFTGEIGGGWQGPGLRFATVQATAPEQAEEALPEDLGSAPLPPWAERVPAPEPAPPKPLAPSRPSGLEPAVRSPLGADDGLRFRRGLIVHRLLQSLPDLPPDRRRAAAERFLASSVHGLDGEQQAELLAETLAVLAQPDFAPLFGPGSRAEVPVVGTIEGRQGTEIVSGQIDRLVVTDQAVLVIDYKTNRPAPASETQVAPLYLRQMALYRAVLQGIYPDRPVRSLLLWTEGPRIMQLSDALLEDHAP